MPYATNLGDILQQLAIHPIASVDADADSTGVDLLDYEGEIAFLLDVGAVSGTTPTAALKLQESSDDSTYTDISGGGFTSYTTVSSKQKISLNSDNLKRYVRLNIDLGGTLPVYLISCQAVAAKKNLS